MKTCGIIAEYNPFHNGHAYQIAKAKEASGADVMIAVMSGNFVQRGEPAIIDKWARTKAAIEHGIDVVIELPYIYATQSASSFGKGAIEILKLAKVDYISFGSECGNLENLLEIADTPINPDHLHQSLAKGLSFPKAYSLLTSSMEPNDILGVSYLQALKGSRIQPILVQRTSGYLDDTLHQHASAYAIRQALIHQQDIDLATPMAKVLKSHAFKTLEDYYGYLRTYVLTSPKSQLERLFLFNEGMECLFVKAAKECRDFNQFLNYCTSRRYTHGRIKRCVLQALNQVYKEDVKRLPKPSHLRILGFNDTGRAWLKAMRKDDTPIASRFVQVPYLYREMEYKACLLYTSVMDEAERERLLQLEIGGAQYIQKAM